MPVSWPDEVDRVLGGDLVAAFAYRTPAGGAVVTAVAPIGLRDRTAGTVGLTTSLGFGLGSSSASRLDPRVALAYHAREHGFFDQPAATCSFRARASFRPQPRPGADGRRSDEISTPFMGEPRRGPRLGLAAARVLRRPRARSPWTVERFVGGLGPDLLLTGEPEVLRRAAGGRARAAAASPKNGTGPRVDLDPARRGGCHTSRIAWLGLRRR